MKNEFDIQIINKLLFLLTERWRYKVAYGGRGSGKSYALADGCLISAIQKPIRILCARQLQTSIRDSVHKLLCDRIVALGMEEWFYITRESIKCKNGSEFIFKGIQNNVMEIKSMEGIDICWVEEAQSVSSESWEVLIPTIRKENSEIWVSFNPDREDDPTYQKFVKNPPPDCKSVLVNYMDNPHFPEVLRKEMEYCKQIDYPRYEHIWLGKTIMETEAQIFKGKFELLDFEADEGTEFFYGADWGFACLGENTLVNTSKGNIPIKDIQVGDMVLSRDGYKKVLFINKKHKKQTYDLDFGYKSDIIITGDHRIYTKDGWKFVKDLKGVENVCVIKKSLMERFISVIQRESTPIISTIKQEKKIESITGIFGNTTMDLFQKVMIFIILMGIHLTTILKTLFVSLKTNIKKFITKKNLVPCQKKKCRILGQKMDIPRKIGRKEEKSLWKRLKKGVVYVKSVVKNLWLQMFTKSFVVQSVENVQIHVIAKKNMFVKCVAKNLWHRLMSSEKLVQKNVPINLRLRKEKETVYDITVEGGEFFANGLLVHNCDPTALTRCFIENNCLYIDYEAGGVGVEMEELIPLFKTVPQSTKWRIRADCARPETISYVARHGFDCVAAEKWKGSIEDGIEYLRSFDKIYIHPRCKHTYEEFKYYSYKKDRISGDILPIIVDDWNHYIDSIRYALEPYIRNKGALHIKDNWESEIDSINDQDY